MFIIKPQINPDQALTPQQILCQELIVNTTVYHTVQQAFHYSGAATVIAKNFFLMWKIQHLFYYVYLLLTQYTFKLGC